MTLASLAEAEPVAVRELRIEGPDGAVVVPYLLFRTRYGYHAAAGDWRGMTTAERTWLLAHEELLNLALARDVEAVDADSRRAVARGGVELRGDLPGNGHLPEGVVRVQAGDSVGGGGPDMENEHGGEEPRPADPVEPGAGGGREVPEAPGDLPEGAPVPEVSPGVIEAQTTATELAMGQQAKEESERIRTDLEKVLIAVDHAAAYLLLRDQMNAAGHMSAKTIYSPFTSTLLTARRRLFMLLWPNVEPPEMEEEPPWLR